MVQFYLLPFPPPPRQPRGQVQPFGPGGGELFEAFLSRWRGAGQIENNFFLFPRSCAVRHFSVDAGPRGEDCLFPGRISRICSRLVREDNLSKLKSLKIKLLNECAFDAYSNSWRSSQTKIYFFCEHIYVYTKTT